MKTEISGKAVFASIIAGLVLLIAVVLLVMSIWQLSWQLALTAVAIVFASLAGWFICLFILALRDEI